MKTKTVTLKQVLPVNAALALVFLSFFAIASGIILKNLLQSSNFPGEPVDKAKLATVQVPFIANQGQTDSRVGYYANLLDGTFFVEKDGTLTYKFASSKDGGVALKEKFTSGKVAVSAKDKVATAINYLVGSRDRWKTGLPAFNTIGLGEVYPGIGVSLKAHNRNVEKIFTVAPLADPNAIRIDVDGAEKLKDGPKGTLELVTSSGTVKFSAPHAWQEIDGTPKTVAVSYKIMSNHEYGFSAAVYDHDLPLTIDPLIASTLVGSPTATESNNVSMARDGNGKIFVGGTTTDNSYPVTSGAYQNTYAGSFSDGVISRFSADLSTLEASTFLGGSSRDFLNSIAVDTAGNVYITGATESPDFPTTSGAYKETFNVANDRTDVFISKLNNNLTSLLASTALGGDSLYNRDGGTDVSIMPGSPEYVLVTGYTKYPGIPTTPLAFDRIYGDSGSTGSQDGFAIRMDTGLTSLLASTYLGGVVAIVGASNESGAVIRAASDGTIYVSGITNEVDFPVTSGAYETSWGGTHQGYTSFICHLDSDFSNTGRACTYFGGTSIDSINSMVPVSDGVYVAGFTMSTDFPSTSGAYDETKSTGKDGFISKLSSDLTTLNISTFYGDAPTTAISGIDRDPATGDIYATGDTQSTTLPVTAGVYGAVSNGCGDEVFVARFPSTLHSLTAASYIGLGFGGPIRYDQASGHVYFAGWGSTMYPTTTGAYNRIGGAGDFFATEIDNTFTHDMPGLTTDLDATGGLFSADLTWCAPPGTPTSYTVEYGTVSGGVFDQTCSDASCTDGTPGATVPNLDPGIEYMFRITAHNAQGSGEISNTATATPYGTYPVDKWNWANDVTIADYPTIGAPDQYDSSSFTDPDGNLVVCWPEQNPGHVRIQKINKSATSRDSGYELWTAGGVIVDNIITAYPQCISDGLGGAYITYYKYNLTDEAHIYLQHIDSDGSLAWPEPKQISEIGDKNGDSVMKLDGSGNIYLAWNHYDSYNGGYPTNEYIYLTHVGPDGNMVAGWNANWSGNPGHRGPLYRPAIIGTVNHSKLQPGTKLLADGTGNIYIPYDANQQAKLAKIMANGDFYSSGNWTGGGGIPLDSMNSYENACIGDGAGGVYCTYSIGNDIKIQRIDIDGNKLWGGGTSINASTTHGRGWGPGIIPAGNGVIVAWTYTPISGNKDVYAQKIDPSGALQWPTTANPSDIPVSDVSDGQDQVFYSSTVGVHNNSIASDNQDGAVIAFESDASTPHTISVQHLNSNGERQWPLGNPSYTGYRFGTSYNNDSQDEYLVSDGTSGAFLTWTSYWDNVSIHSDLYGQYLNLITPSCNTLGSNEFCGNQQISSSVLTFTNIPNSFTFPGVNVSSSAQPVFNNNAADTQPALEDLMGVQDNRNSGGFEVQVQATGNFSDGTHTIPLSDLHIATSVSSPTYSVPSTDNAFSCPASQCGVVYGAGIGDKTVSAPEDSLGNSLGMPSTYPADLGSGPVVLMDGSLPSTSGRNGLMYQFINFYLDVPPFQPEGYYSLVLTYTLLDNTT